MAPCGGLIGSRDDEQRQFEEPQQRRRSVEASTMKKVEKPESYLWGVLGLALTEEGGGRCHLPESRPGDASRLNFQSNLRRSVETYTYRFIHSLRIQLPVDGNSCSKKIVLRAEFKG